MFTGKYQASHISYREKRELITLAIKLAYVINVCDRNTGIQDAFFKALSNPFDLKINVTDHYMADSKIVPEDCSDFEIYFLNTTSPELAVSCVLSKDNFDYLISKFKLKKCQI